MIIEIVTTLGIVIIVVLFLNPTHLTMPQSFQSMLILGLIIAFLAFAALLWREKAADERDQLHILKAGRISFLVGVGVLVVGIIRQALMHEIDPWLVVSLSVMVLGKLISRIYSSLKM